MMKRIIAWVLAMIMILGCASALAAEALPGYTKENGYTYVTLGSYPQWIEGGNPPEKAWTWSRNKLLDHPPTVEATPILWRVLESDGKKALLLSEYVLFAHPVHTNITEYKKLGVNFADTQLGHYLVEKFLPEAFTAEEQAMMAENDAGTLVTLLTASQLNNKAYGLGTEATRKAWATEYAIRVTDVFVYRVQMGQHTPYWVQDQAKSDARHARCTKQEGGIGHIVCDRDNEGVRPVIYVDLEKTDIASGKGTMTDPYTLKGK